MSASADSLSREALTLLAEAASAINGSLDPDVVLNTIASSAARVADAEASGVLTLDDRRNKLVFVAAAGEEGKQLVGREFPADSGIAGRVASRATAEIVADVQSDADFYQGIDKLTEIRTRSLMAAPMIVRDRVIGVVEVLNARQGSFSADDLQVLEVFAVLAATAVHNAQAHDHLRRTHRDLCDEVHGAAPIIGSSAALERVREMCRKAAPSDTTVLLLGETGTGKELFAHYIHAGSPRSEERFVAVNCAALAENVVESELFGHERGAFTGATNRRIGRFELADKGTVFLDEIGDIPPSTQVKLLRVLQEHTIERVGGSETIRCDARVVAATNRDLKEQIRNGAFREDLYYRLNVFPVELPPLRNRREDIGELVEYFASRAAAKTGLAAPRITPAASGVLTSYDWPGNVRELQNIMERAVLLSDGETIQPADLPMEIAGEAEQDAAPAGEMTLRGMERAVIARALRDCKWNQSEAARSLGISRDNLRYRVKKYSIVRDGKPGELTS